MAAKIGGQIPNTFLHYSRWDVISAFHKELRRGDLEQATYWLQVMLDGGAPHTYIAKYLWQIAAEELAPDQHHAFAYYAMMRQNVEALFPYHFYYAVYLFCTAKKWWQDDAGTELRMLWGEHARAIKEGRFREIPDYAHDKHTAKGKSLLKKGEADRRWEGSWAGMVFRREAQLIADREGRDITDIEWDEVYGTEKGKKLLEYWDYMEENVC